MNIKDLKRQHVEITKSSNYILDNVDKATVEKNVHEIVKSINTVSGKLKIHLLSEDKYLYPHLLESENPKLNLFGKNYYEEMNKFSPIYEKYKSNYNTASKIKDNLQKFNVDTEQVFKLLMDRINREEKELYPLLD
ncbi:hemerythrin domain-containing protein [Clostridium fermenticellae]|uniref:Hemerythrin domain-containing protein n=1 Tax=Clostridium fermenticellae TaxID=2068654 RepID=A0A386H5N7_9CLOT|nr:hemerythrin domain-containing protein [Clostridium fermenticellae]AYD40878.1 hemerythrin domain-containing protein [Clostridium fermenticellae]